MNPNIHYKLASIDDLSAMIDIGDELFDYDVKPNRAREFLEDPRHHMILAYDDNKIVGMASAINYVHPDKDPALFINEVSVIDEFQNQGIGRTMVRKLCEFGKEIGCEEAWVATENSNSGARKAYQAAGGKEDPEPVVLINFDI